MASPSINLRSRERVNIFSRFPRRLVIFILDSIRALLSSIVG